MKQDSNIAVIGHNNPPTPFDEIKEEIESLYEEATNWCDGEAIENQETADKIDTLVGMIKDAAKRGEALRKAEAKPFDDGKKAVQDKFNPLIQKGKGKTDLALSACNQLLTPWKQKLERERLAKLEEERKAAEEAQRKAQEEIQKSQGDLEARALAEEQAKQAKQLERQANRTARENTKGMRTIRHVKIADMQALAKWFWVHHRDDLEVFMLEKVKQYDRAGQRGIKGIEVTEERVAK